jgi:3-dehydroquinate synthase
VLALGGGVVGDLAGFVAASYMRGIAFYQIPTTLLAMVDSSVGGKTGINLDEGKNLVGAFWQPKAVFTDVRFLRSLPEREFRQGAVELFKHGLLADKSILADVENPEFNSKGDTTFLIDIIKRSVKVKADIVAVDEKEQNIRAYLNLGHTLAHALEAASHHHLTHGEAVAYGLVFDAHLSRQRGYADEVERVVRFLNWLKPKALGVTDLGVLEPYMLRDKKNEAGKVKFVILKEIGEPVIVDDITLPERKQAWLALTQL